MKLWLGAEMDLAVADDFRIIRNNLVAKINERIEQFDAEQSNEWDVIAIVRDDSHFKETVRFTKKDGMDIRLQIDFSEFLQGSEEQRISLLIQLLIRSLDIISKQFPNITFIDEVKTIVKNT